MVELLAPAGDKERLKIAFLYGADAVYFGGQDYSLRANAKNFNLDEIKDATLYAHRLNKKVYVTVNIFFHNEDIKNIDDYLLYLYGLNIDGVIVSDILVIKRINELKINIPVILSTQNSTLNSGAVKFWQNLGIKRIVLARESSRENIKEIIDETSIEIECFIHGAMCTSISGKCVLSNYLTNRDSNRGGCAQICRWSFTSDNMPDFTMTSKDLNMVDNIPDMIDIGISSFKIEGRMRSIYYLATVVLCYRKIIDLYLNDELTKQLKNYYLDVLNRCANRDSAPQFYNNETNEFDEYWNNREELTNQDFLGIVKSYDDNTNIAVIEQRNYFKIGDTIQFFGPNMETFDYYVHKIYDENDNEIAIANHPQMIIKLKVNKKLNEFDMLRIKIFDKNNYL